MLRRNPYYWKARRGRQSAPVPRRARVQALDLGRSRRAGCSRHRRFLQPRTGRKLCRSPEAFRRSVGSGASCLRRPHHRLFALYPNLSANGWGEPDARAEAVRNLNRNLDFRLALTSAIDRQHLGDLLVKGPFTAIYPGGLYAGTAFYDKASTVHQLPARRRGRQSRTRKGRPQGHRRQRHRQLPGRYGWRGR